MAFRPALTGSFAFSALFLSGTRITAAPPDCAPGPRSRSRKDVGPHSVSTNQRKPATRRRRSKKTKCPFGSPTPEGQLGRRPRAPGPSGPGQQCASQRRTPGATLIGGCCSLSHNIGPAPFSVKRRPGANPYNLKDSPCRRIWLHACPPSSDPTESNRERTHRNWLVHFARDLSVSEPTFSSGLALRVGSYN